MLTFKIAEIDDMLISSGKQPRKFRHRCMVWLLPSQRDEADNIPHNLRVPSEAYQSAQVGQRQYRNVGKADGEA
jgi:hypothetical protein